MSQMFVLTCEHAGNTIPPEYAYLFKGKEEEFYTHKAIDFGALRLAKHFAAETGFPLYYTTISRLLVEANRSPDEEELFSEFTKDEPKIVKDDILDKYYGPHRKKVEDKMRDLIKGGNQVIHLAVHTFAPVLEGEVRDTEVGILYDPERTKEEKFAEAFKKEILNFNPKIIVHLNRPYPGNESGFPKFLRKQFSKDQYLGFEIEVNQNFFLTGEADIWENLVQELTGSLLALKNH